MALSNSATWFTAFRKIDCCMTFCSNSWHASSATRSGSLVALLRRIRLPFSSSKALVTVSSGTNHSAGAIAGT